MPNPEPTLAEICKTTPIVTEPMLRMYKRRCATLRDKPKRTQSVIVHRPSMEAMLNEIDSLRLALVQAAEQGERYRKKMDEIHARETARIGPHGGIDSTDCALAGGMLNAVEEIRQALSSGAPT